MFVTSVEGKLGDGVVCTCIVVWRSWLSYCGRDTSCCGVREGSLRVALFGWQVLRESGSQKVVGLIGRRHVAAGQGDSRWCAGEFACNTDIIAIWNVWGDPLPP